PRRDCMQEVSWILSMIISWQMIHMNLKKVRWPFSPGKLMFNWNLMTNGYQKNFIGFFSICVSKTGFYTTSQQKVYIIVSVAFAGGQKILMIRNPFLTPFSIIMKS